jgi:hypothetical protein
VSSMRRPEPSDLDYQAEADERVWQDYCRLAKGLDVGEIITAVCEQIRGEPGDTALSALVEDWLLVPQWDWQRPLITPLQAERVGRYVAGVVSVVIAQAIATALARED